MVCGKAIGFAILNYNDYNTTKCLLEHIMEFDVIDKIVVADNHSNDGSYEKLLQYAADKILIFQTERNGGYSYGNNAAASVLIDNGCDIIFFANPDVVFDEEYVYIIAKDLYNGPMKAAAGLMRGADGCWQKTVIENNSYIDDLFDCFFILKKFNRKIKKLKPDSGIVETGQLSGSLFAIDAKAFQSIQGFDENVFLYCEERMIGERLKKKKYRMAVDTSVSFYHYHSKTISQSMNSLKQIEKMFESRLYFYENYKSVSKMKLHILSLAMKLGIGIRKMIWRI